MPCLFLNKYKLTPLMSGKANEGLSIGLDKQYNFNRVILIRTLLSKYNCFMFAFIIKNLVASENEEPHTVRELAKNTIAEHRQLSRLRNRIQMTLHGPGAEVSTRAIWIPTRAWCFYRTRGVVNN